MERKKTVVWEDPKLNQRNAAASLPGLAYLEGIKEGRIGAPPVASLVGYRVHAVESGYAAFELDPAEYHYNPFSTVHGGILTTLLDTTMTAAVLTTLPQGMSCATIEIKVNFIRPVTARTGLLRCEARPVHRGRHLATVEGRLKDRGGTLYAHGISTCSIFNVPPPAADAEE
ncbi:MAG: PaaI family thioesterase [Deltaproteobacteria bacterium]|jgi:uncharacterized protein (TIGR00369 family)|nr:PaaI family thioesterase [Deltaproteobacteria bacterium]